MNYERSQHAKTVMTEREIPVDWLEHALRAPARTEPDKKEPASSITWSPSLNMAAACCE